MKLAEKKLSIKSIVILTIIIPVIVIAASSAAIIITAKSVQPGASLDMSLLEDMSFTEDKTAKDALDRLTQLTKSTIEAKTAKYDGTVRADITKTECGDKNTEKLFSYIAPKLSEKFTSLFEGSSVKYGGEVSRLASILPSSEPDSFTQSFNNGYVDTVLTYSSATDNMYFLQKDTAAINLFIKENEGVFSSINERLIPVAIEYSYRYEAESNRLIYVSSKRIYEYSSDISFVNTLSALGNTSFLINVCVSEEYNISYAGISIVEDEKTLTENGYDTLTVIPYTEAELKEDEYSLSFTSSDESIVTVDENGQVTAVGLSGEPVTVTVELTYLGQSFTDSCLIYAVKPVEDVTISNTALTLKEGESYTISATISPEDASCKKICYVSSDADIATVASDGRITAVKEGTATVYAYSLQGYVASACSVTVTK